ncbi:hypothetical protein PR202_gb10346 [Eleusine coracana subsp. coracana]|uniref:Serine-threonine/tyrosine-protein kinase catalytic domain-containing protein n=1 Tax=Eleusine coracana subsp. coracana TaxID=191504 RepID=A0AAV5EJH5_ELECO|nr:hypothetical protein PR202_gb10346 [Eleusine coracana subsp. coracana]
MNEVRSLMDLKHRNMVKLIGYCYDVQKKLVESSGKYTLVEMGERLLCYEYLPRGSLDKYLCGIILSVVLYIPDFGRVLYLNQLMH